jgi:hypothetical protein
MSSSGWLASADVLIVRCKLVAKLFGNPRAEAFFKGSLPSTPTSIAKFA